MCILAGGEFLGFSCEDSVTVVLEDDGTIVEDDAYFLCLPINTKFMLLHAKESWSPLRRSKKGFLGCWFIFSPDQTLSFLDLVYLAVSFVPHSGWRYSLDGQGVCGDRHRRSGHVAR